MSALMIANLKGTITQLKNASKGHGPLTVSQMSKAMTELMTKKRAATPELPPVPKFTACFDSTGEPSLEHFKSMLQKVTSPARMHIPLAVGGNHITALVVDIDINGKSDVLFFNSLGKSNQGHYYEHAKLFIEAVREKFPAKNDYHVTQAFQTGAGDNFCGDWSMWFLTICANLQAKSLGQLRAHFDNLNVTPDPRTLRSTHIKLLEGHLGALEAPTPVETTPVVIATPERADNPSLIQVDKPHPEMGKKPGGVGFTITDGVVIEDTVQKAERDRAAKEAAQQKTEGSIHLKMVEIEKVLVELKGKIGGIDQHKWPKAYDKATFLLVQLESARISYESNLRDSKIMPKAEKLFKIACTKVITDAMPILEKDLGWGDFLLNALKTLCSNIITLGNRSDFFPRVQSQSAQAVKDAGQKLDLDLRELPKP